MPATNTLLTIAEELDKRTGGTRESNIAKTVRGWYKQSQDARISKDKKLLDQYKIYRFYGQRPKFPWRSDMYVPTGHVNILVKTAKMFTAILASDPFFRGIARSMRFMQNEEAVEQLMVQQLEDMGWPEILYGWILNHYIFGTAILKGYWKYEEVVEEVEETGWRDVTVMDGDTVMGITQEPYTKIVKKRRVVFDGPVFEVVNIFDCYWDPRATSMKNALYVVHKKGVSIDHLRSMVDIGVYKKAAVDAIAAKQAAGETDTGNKAELDAIDDETIATQQGPLIDILECWTPTRKIVIGPDDELLQDKRGRPDYQYFDFSHLPNPHRLFGIGTNEPVEKIQKATNKVHRLRMDNWVIQVHKIFLVSEGAVRNPSDIVARPGALLRIKDGRDLDNSIKELSKQPLPMESYMEQDVLERLNEVGTGVNEPSKGIERRSGKGETATKTRESAAGASTRFGVELILVEPRIKEVLKFMHSLNQKFLDPPRMVRVMGEEGRRYPLVGSEQIQGAMDFKFELAPLQGNKEAWLQRVMLVYKQHAENPYIAPMTNWLEFSKRLVKAADLRNPEMLFGPQYMQQNMMMAMIAQGGGPQAPGGGGENGPATNPEAGAMNAQTRMPQPTPRDARRDMFARMA